MTALGAVKITCLATRRYTAARFSPISGYHSRGYSRGYSKECTKEYKYTRKIIFIFFIFCRKRSFWETGE